MTPSQTLKRFYARAEAVGIDDGFTIELDGKAVRTPAKAALILPSHTLALAIAAEWADQGETIDPQAMPLARLAYTAIDRTGPDHTMVVQSMVAYGKTDLICYEAAEPPALRARQQAAWPPVRAWAAGRGLELAVTDGLIAVTQPAATLTALEAAITALGPFALTAYGQAVTLLGSAVLGLALLDAAFDEEEIWQAGTVDERYQLERWGSDAEAEARLEQCRRELASAHRFYRLL